jgi:Uma2 family endonuclease
MATPKRATYQDVLTAPPDKVTEIINGKLHVFPRPSLPHSLVASVLGTVVSMPFMHGRGGPGGWIILDEPELHLAEDILVPDLAGWRRERLPTIDRVAYTTLAPDWSCEVLSPSTEKIDRSEKLAIYAAAGVRHVWLINPTIRTLEVLRIGDGKCVTLSVHCDDQQFRAEPFEAILLELATLWADLSPTGGRASEPTAMYAP